MARLDDYSQFCADMNKRLDRHSDTKGRSYSFKNFHADIFRNSGVGADIFRVHFSSLEEAQRIFQLLKTEQNSYLGQAILSEREYTHKV